MPADKPAEKDPETDGKHVKPGTDEPAADASISEPQVTPEDWPEPETDPSKVEINKFVTEYGRHADSGTYGRGGAQAHRK